MTIVFSRLYLVIISLVLISTGAFLNAQELNAQSTFNDLESGVHYDFTKKEAKYNRVSKLEVIEAFAYSCPHCATMETKLPAWEKKLPKGVKFTKIPVQWSPIFHATLYWALLSMGKEAELTPHIFRSVGNGRSLRSFRDADTFLRQYGVSQELFAKHMRSFFVTTAMRKSGNLLSDWGVRSTPAFVVNGKYIVPGSRNRRVTHDEMLQIVNILIAHEAANL